MDLLEFEGQEMYFDSPVSAKVEVLLNKASEYYGEPEAEASLLEAYLLEPENLIVLVAMYRFYYYQYKLQDALGVAHRALAASGNKLGFPLDWKLLSMEHIGIGAMTSMSLVRFYLLCLKATGFLHLRLGLETKGIQMLEKVSELDKSDRLGAEALLQVVKNSLPISSNKTAMSA